MIQDGTRLHLWVKQSASVSNFNFNSNKTEDRNCDDENEKEDNIEHDEVAAAKNDSQINQPGNGCKFRNIQVTQSHTNLAYNTDL